MVPVHIQHITIKLKSEMRTIEHSHRVIRLLFYTPSIHPVIHSLFPLLSHQKNIFLSHSLPTSLQMYFTTFKWENTHISSAHASCTDSPDPKKYSNSSSATAMSSWSAPDGGHPLPHVALPLGTGDHAVSIARPSPMPPGKPSGGK